MLRRGCYSRFKFGSLLTFFLFISLTSLLQYSSAQGTWKKSWQNKWRQRKEAQAAAAKKAKMSEEQLQEEELNKKLVFNALKNGLKQVEKMDTFKLPMVESILEMLEDQIFTNETRYDKDIKPLASKVKAEANQMLGMSARSSSNSQQNCRSGEVGCGSMFNLDAIWQYGCFCNFGTEWQKSHGQPMNEIDSICKRLYQCYKCATIDGRQEGNECNPATQQYSVPVIRDVNTDGSYVACNQMNTNDLCKIRTCCCDLNFAKDLLEFFFSGQILDPDLKHSNGFSMDESCPTCSGPWCKQGEKQCCGDYPERYPYNTKNGDRACCWTKTYNTNKLQCCENTFVKKLTQSCD